MKRESGVIRQLQSSVSNHFGKHVTTATDCDHLAYALKKNLNADISSQTLRRFFGLVRSSSQTSIFTLNILAQFCGFKSFENFSKSFGNNELEEFFHSSEGTAKEFWEKSAELCRQIADSPEQLVKLHHRMMPFPMVRKYFMENHPMRDMLGSVYVHYFFTYLRFDHSNGSKIFAYSFLFHSAFLVQNDELMELFSRKVIETEVSPEMHLLPTSMKYGVMLLYADYCNDDTGFRKIFEEMKVVRQKYLEISQKSVCSFEYTVLESLIFSERLEEIKFLIEINRPQLTSDETFVPDERVRTHQEVWNILCAAAFQKLGDEKKAQEYLEMINLENLGFGWKKYYSMIFYSVKIQQTQGAARRKICTILEDLIKETHFGYFNRYLTDISKDPDTGFPHKRL